MVYKMTEVIGNVKTFVIDDTFNLSVMAAGNRVKFERINRKWSQQQLADELTRMGYEMSQSGVARLEDRDVKRPKCTRELCALFDITETWLLTGRGEKHPQPVDRQIERLVSDLKRLSVKDQEIIIAGTRTQVDVALRNQKEAHAENGGEQPHHKMNS